MVSGRGLGITGGTLDKLEAIPGYRTALSLEEFLGVVRTCGCSLIGQTAELVPADRKLYALRDVTGTVPSIPLISASIMSKKLAEGLDALVLDVKWGKGAFMKTPEQARELARTMVEIGRRMGKGMTALITDMNQPLGRAAGNALEIAETVQTLRGRGPEDLVQLTLELAAHMLRLTERAASHLEALTMLQRALASGEAFERFRRMVVLQGGDASVLDDVSRLPAARLREALAAPSAGYVEAADAELIGKAGIVLGAGRRRVEDPVDSAVGVSDIAKIGERISGGQPLAVLHANDAGRLAEARTLAAAAFRISAQKTAPPPLVVEVIA
jgi:pyrimidine-nucleoside phosphorylase